MIAKLIKNLRIKNKMSQAYLAKQLNMSRPTFIQIENGQRDITLTETYKIAEIFDLSLTDMLAGKTFKDPEVKLPKSSKQTKQSSKKAKPDIRINVPQKNLEKFKEVLLYILEKVGAKPNVGETVIYKLLYFIDFDFYEKYESQLIGATYIKNHHGPTPVEFAAITKQMQKMREIELIKSKYFEYDQKKYLPLREPDLSKLSGLEKEHIDEVLNRLSDKSARELSDYTHEDVPWKVHSPNEVIDYETVFYRDHKYSVKNYDDEV